MEDHEAFVNVWYDHDGMTSNTESKGGFYGEWSKQGDVPGLSLSTLAQHHIASAKHSDPLLVGYVLSHSAL